MKSMVQWDLEILLHMPRNLY